VGARPSFEAILCDVPVIVTRSTGAGEDIEEIDAGYLVDHGDNVGLSQAMQYILDNPKIAQLKTQKAKEWIKENLSLEKQVDKYEQLYKEAIA
jgi:glycosyltransferase involved in cell wall biosynthesis